MTVKESYHMKRIRTALVGLCAVVGLLLALPIPVMADDAYEPATDWITYVLTVNEHSQLEEHTPPSAAFTEAGYGVASTAGFHTYTMGPLKPVSISGGAYMELEVPRASMNGVLCLSIWNTDRTVPGYTQLGSGFGSMMAVDDDGRLMVMNTLISARTDDEQELSRVFPPMTIDAKLRDENTYVFTLEITNGTIYINGVAIEDGKTICAYLQWIGQNGLYVSATMTAEDAREAAPMTVTRFGKKRATAYVPGTTPPPEETGVFVPDTEPPIGSVTEALTTSMTATPTEPSTEAPTEPPVTTEELTSNLMDYYEDLYDRAGGCSSLIGATTLVSLASLAAAAYVVRRKS